MLLEGARIVTILGPAGMGKSRLAREAVAARSVLRVELERVGRDGSALSATARALGLRPRGSWQRTLQPVMDALAAHPAELLLFDADPGRAGRGLDRLRS